LCICLLVCISVYIWKKPSQPRLLPNSTRYVGYQNFLYLYYFFGVYTTFKAHSEFDQVCRLPEDFEERNRKYSSAATLHPRLSSRCTDSTLNMENPAYIPIITPCVHTYVLILTLYIPGVAPTVQAAPQMCKKTRIQFQSHTLFLHIHSHSHTLHSRRYPHCNSSTFKIEKPAYMYYHILYSFIYFHSHTLYSRRCSHCTNSTSNL